VMAMSELVDNLVRDSYLRHNEIVEDLEKGKIHVSLLVRCPRYRELLKRYGHLFHPPTPTLVGQLIHAGVREVLGHLKGTEYEVRKEREVGDHVVVGTADILRPGEVIEVKYMRSHKDDKPLPHHLLQLRAYMWLFDKPKGRLLYISHDRICEYTVEEPMTDDEVKALLMDNSSPRWPEWECDYCEFNGFCEKRIQRR